MPRRVCAFSIAHTNISSQPFHNGGRTVRIHIPNNLNGDAVYLKFSNYFAKEPVWIEQATIAISDKKGAVIQETIRPVTVAGDTSFAIVPKRDLFSDRVAFPVKAGQTLSVSLYYPCSRKISSGNFIGTYATRSTKGNFTTCEKMPVPRILSTLSKSVLPWDATSPITTLSSLLIEQPDTEPPPRVIAAFGDSIMQQNTWLSPFAERLFHHFPGAASLCNLGIGGNRLLHESPSSVKGLYGPAGIKRFHHDIMTMEGLTHVILALGTNDLGLPGKDGTPMRELITLEQYQTAIQYQLKYLRKRNLKIFACLILPREINTIFTQEREQTRLAINQWLSTCGLFDGIFDFVKPVCGANGTGIKKNFFLPDGLHPNKFGGIALAKSIPLSWFETMPE